ncbi:hypothetical protein GCM10008955_10610 [Deinococcus malanensis]|uniref:Malate synthase n=1 Tax=Deinococcus malanensis TaxID=1706855 RepID=A0ABQ2EP61_9DEIO|nr:hypothetical protein [Deinococcus malanensis]GGK19049.1 hypothetical protein GCM10008955_10610 [Deinococcus malanensis]
MANFADLVNEARLRHLQKVQQSEQAKNYVRDVMIHACEQIEHSGGVLTDSENWSYNGLHAFNHYTLSFPADIGISDMELQVGGRELPEAGNEIVVGNPDTAVVVSNQTEGVAAVFDYVKQAVES